MNNVKRKNKIYYYIDIFFLSAPILLLVAFWLFVVFNSVFSGSNLKGYDSTFNYGSFEDYWTFLDDFLFQFFTSNGTFNNGYSPYGCIDLFHFSGGFFGNFEEYLFSFIESLIGNYDSSSFTYFLSWYFVYAISYEFFSLFINIVLWLPRYIRSWVQEKGANV